MTSCFTRRTGVTVSEAIVNRFVLRINCEDLDENGGVDGLGVRY